MFAALHHLEDRRLKCFDGAWLSNDGIEQQTIVMGDRGWSGAVKNESRSPFSKFLEGHRVQVPSPAEFRHHVVHDDHIAVFAHQELGRGARVGPSEDAKAELLQLFGELTNEPDILIDEPHERGAGRRFLHGGRSVRSPTLTMVTTFRSPSTQRTDRSTDEGGHIRTRGSGERGHEHESAERVFEVEGGRQ